MNNELISTQRLAQAAQQLKQVQDNISKVLIGQEQIIEQVIIALIANGHVLLESVPGLGKTLLVRALAESLGVDAKRVQFTPDLMPADVTGHSMLDMTSGQFTLRKGPAFTNLLLADEINRAPAKTQAALLEVMQERQITIDGNSHQIDAPFMVLATQNPIDNEGTYPLPEAELDRFMFKVLVDYPSCEDEVQLTQLNTQSLHQNSTTELTSVLDSRQLIDLQTLATQILIDPQVVNYAVQLVRNTREWQGIVHGAGIRASIALVQAAKVKAVMLGQGFVTPDHIKAIAKPVLRHRIILSAEREIAGVSSEQVIEQILEQTPAPRQ